MSMEVARGIAKGLLCKEIAYQLGISVRTVEDFQHQIFMRLGCHNTVQLTRMVYGIED
jgi:DNA-binding NarL/FixJ family response regulator